MKLIIDIPDEAYRARQHWVANPKRIIDEVDTAIAHGTPYNPSGDLISRSALKETINSSIAEATEVGIVVNADYLWKLLDYAIDNAPTVEPDLEFAKWVTNMIFDNQVKDFDFEMFSELACRKLEKMGLVKKTESEWIKKGGAE